MALHAGGYGDAGDACFVAGIFLYRRPGLGDFVADPVLLDLVADGGVGGVLGGCLQARLRPVPGQLQCESVAVARQVEVKAQVQVSR